MVINGNTRSVVKVNSLVTSTMLGTSESAGISSSIYVQTVTEQVCNRRSCVMTKPFNVDQFIKLWRVLQMNAAIAVINKLLEKTQLNNGLGSI
jgi:hypothetical protein